MNKSNLPANPNLEQYRKIAKAFVKAWKRNAPTEIPWEGSMITVTREHLRQKHPRLSRLSELEAASAEICLADAQFLIAREYGFDSWSKFVRFIEGAAPSGEAIPTGESVSLDANRFIDAKEPLAVSAVGAIQAGDVEELNRLLEENPGLATARIAEAGPHGPARSLLHVATDWPGHFPRVAETISVLVAAGAEIDAPFIGGRHTETALHWAASSNDLEALNALLEAGADIEAKGAVIANGTPLSDAVAFAQWQAAYRLTELGAAMTFAHEAALGFVERMERRFEGNDAPSRDEIDVAFWFACHGGQCDAAEYLLGKGADRDWLPPWEKKTPLEAAVRSGFGDVAAWLRGLGIK